MGKEYFFYFAPSDVSHRLLDRLQELEDSGIHLGFTFRGAHTCFTEQQLAKFRVVLDEFAEQGLEFETCECHTGDVSEDDVGIPVFKQPLVEWCPVAIVSARFKRVINDREPWGLTTDRSVVLPVELRELIVSSVSGLQRTDQDESGSFDIYELLHRDVPAQVEHVEDGSLLRVAGPDLPEADIMETVQRRLVCSLRLAKLLKRYWKGYVDTRFQPVICEQVSPAMRKRLTRKLSAPRPKASLRADVKQIEAALGVCFPKEYVRWLEGFPKELPQGWLSPRGGARSELMKVMLSEQTEAEPAMPPELVPIYADGSGDYVCFHFPVRVGKGPRNEWKLVEWSHEDGSYVELELPQGLAGWLREATS
jgi:hypothetical protein